MAFLRKFFASPYFNPVALSVFSIISGFVVALFPYNDLSITRMLRPAVMLVGVGTMCVSFMVITYIMAVSYHLDRKYDWHTLHSGRYALQAIFGGLVPLGMVMIYEWVFYGWDLMQSDPYYFVFALQLFMIYLINERGYMVYLSQRKRIWKAKLEEAIAKRQKAEAEHKLLSERYALLNKQFEALQTAKDELEGHFLAYQTRELSMQEQILDRYMVVERFLFGAKDTGPYIVRIGHRELHIEEKDIMGFKIDGGNNKKPFIYIKTADEKYMLTSEESMDRINEGRFPNYLRLNRQMLVSPQGLISYTVDEDDGGCWIRTALADEPIYVSKNKWGALQDRVRLIFALSPKAS